MLSGIFKSIHGFLIICTIIFSSGVSVHGFTIHKTGLGPANLGMRYEEQLNQLQWGQPDQNYMSDDKIVSVYESQGVTFIYQVDRTTGDTTDAINKSTLTEIVITTSVFSDDEGRGVGRPCADDCDSCSGDSSGVFFECADDGYISKVRIKNVLAQDIK